MSDKDIAISVSGLSKLYRIGVKAEASENLASSLANFFRSPLRNYRKYRSLYKFNDVDLTTATDARRANSDVIWALQDVSFDVPQGQVLGIIGRNGAGKSTLLKVLTRITPPTKGNVQVRGRVSSLLEVGTGFHPELTGRENVYLNGTILGMRRTEVDRKFDEIVEFSGVGKFLDTPVKRYSSGMRVRLAFAVAAHLEPEILIIDEVLAVGDAAFQNKCLNKMQDVSAQGRTVLFVSHNMPAVTRLCDRVILLNQGGLEADGSTHEIVGNYLNSGTGTSAAQEWPDPATAPGGNVARLNAVRVIDEAGCITESVDIRQKIGIQMEYEVLESGYELMPHYFFFNEEGVIAFGTVDQNAEWRGKPRPEGHYVSTVWIPGNLLAEGSLYVNCNMITLSPNILQFQVRQAVAFHVIDSVEGDSARGLWSGNLDGVVRPLLEWSTEYKSTDIISASAVK